MSGLLRIRFKANGDDPRPINWPVAYPYWITGESLDGSYSTVVSYADSEQYIFTNWPEATDLSIQQADGYVFTDRFPKPEWFLSKSAAPEVSPEVCPTCGQSDHGQYGEYPCVSCGLPWLHDEPMPPAPEGENENSSRHYGCASREDASRQ